MKCEKDLEGTNFSRIVFGKNDCGGIYQDVINTSLADVYLLLDAYVKQVLDDAFSKVAVDKEDPVAVDSIYLALRGGVRKAEQASPSTLERLLVHLRIIARESAGIVEQNFSLLDVSTDIRPYTPSTLSLIQEQATLNSELIKKSVLNTGTDKIQRTLEETQNAVNEIISKQIQYSEKTFSEIVENISKTTKVSESKAKFWAYDQSNKIYANINTVQIDSSGISSKRRVTMDDDAVRPTHAEQHGVVFEGSDWPGGIEAGVEPNCRCIDIVFIKGVSDDEDQAYQDEREELLEEVED